METVLQPPTIDTSMSDGEITEEEIREMNKKEFRKNFPSGWMKLTRYETNILVIDTLLQEPPSREFTANELADLSGASKRSIQNRIEDLVDLGVVTELPDRDSTRYQFNQYSPIVNRLHEMNTTINRVMHEDIPKTCSPPKRNSSKNVRGNMINLDGPQTNSNNFISSSNAF